jgi:hypothetical protein
MDWNIKSELANLHSATGDGVPHPSLEAIFRSRITEVRDWYRAGSETYVYVFSVAGPEIESTFIAKALIAPLPGTPPERQVERWLRRRTQLMEGAIKVPELLGVGKGLLVERFIDFSLEEAASRVECVVEKYIELVERVIDAGFTPTDFIHNIRTDGEDLYWIDFGEDLGGSSRTDLRDKDDIMSKALHEYDSMNLRVSVN